MSQFPVLNQCFFCSILTDILAPQEEDTDLTKSIKRSILEYLNDKYSDPETSRLLNMCSLTDPRFKITYIEDNKIQEVKSQAVDEVESLLANTHSESDTVESSSTASAEAPSEPTARKSKTLGTFFKQATSSSSSRALSQREAIEKEMEIYLPSVDADGDTNPLRW